MKHVNSSSSSPLYRWLPNLLTILRLLTVPLIIWLILKDHFQSAFLFFALASITDYIDGFLARRWNVESTFGRLVDPLADKSLLVLSYLALGYKGLLPLWIVYLVIGRDILILLAALVIYLKNLPMKFTPILSSKINTTSQIILVGLTLLLIMFQQTSINPYGFLHNIISFLNGSIFAILWLTAITTVWSGIEYAIGFVQKNCCRS